MKVDIKGKNGWFSFKEAQVEEIDCLGRRDILIQLFSHRKPYSNLAPACIQGQKSEVEALLLDLLEKVRAIP
jgi:hypothetical protein